MTELFNQVLLKKNLSEEGSSGAKHFTVVLTLCYFLFLPVMLNQDHMFLIFLGSMWLP